MSTETSKPGVMFIHSCYVPDLGDGTDAVVIKEKLVHPDGRTEPRLVVKRSPTREVFITKRGMRDHDEKKEAEEIQALDRLTVPNARLEYELFRALNGFTPNRKPRLNELCNSPYVYGADISIETSLKAEYQQKFAATGLTPQPVTTGNFDVETSVLPGNFGELLMVTVTHEHKVYTAILEHAFFKFDDRGNHLPGDLGELKELAHQVLDPKVAQVFELKSYAHLKGKKPAFDYEFFVGKTPLELLLWIFDKINENKTDFIGGWNIDYDLQTVLRVCKEAKVEPGILFCPKGMPKELRYVRYAEDNKEVPHFTRKWHWLHASCTAQFYDSMCLYSVLRTVAGFEPSYKLEDILAKNIGVGKLHFDGLPGTEELSEIDWHRHMQTKESYRYILYNMWDVMSLQLMEWRNTDVQSMFMLSGVSSLSKYTRQTRKAADTIYFEWMEKGLVLASPGSDMTGKWDHLIGKVGGAVLRPELMDNSGLKILADAPDVVTLMHGYVNDVDFAAMYPTVDAAANISKMTKQSTLLLIDGKKDQQLFSLLVSPQENAITIGTRYFGLPDFAEMEALYRASLAGGSLSS